VEDILPDAFIKNSKLMTANGPLKWAMELWRPEGPPSGAP